MDKDKHVFVPSSQLFKAAYGRFALGAYSVNNMEQILGLMQGNAQAQAPFILAISRKARAYAGPHTLDSIVRLAADAYPEAILAVHLDHGDEVTCYNAIESGFYTSVMIDASHYPFEENVAITRRIVERARELGVSVEAELGTLGGVEDDIRVDENHAHLTDPAQAAEFVARTGITSLAVAIGTSHGPYKFAANQGLHLERLAAIQDRLPGFPLVLHGASCVPEEEVVRINAAGGALAETAQGLSEADIPRTVPLGITKINIDTDCRLVWMRVHREFFRDHPAGLDFREPGQTFMQAYAELVARRSTVLGSAGQLAAVRAALAPATE